MDKKGKLELTWVGKNDEKELEPRILVEDKEKSYGDQDTDNMLIHGDNLLALKALENEYSGKINCIYIDPPYNTGSAFEDYDDGIEHSIWLNIMYSRLTILKRLLAETGVIWVQVGYDEMAYLKVIMDEIFNRNHCLGQVAVRMSHSAGMKRKAADKRMIKNTEYLLVYYKDNAPTLNPLYEECKEYPVNYYQYITRFPSSDKPVGEYCSLSEITYKKFRKYYDLYQLPDSNKAISFLYANIEEFQEFVLNNKDRIVRKDSNAPTYDANKMPRLDDNQFIAYLTDTGENYYLGLNSSANVYQIYSLADKVRMIETVDDEGNTSKREALTNLVGDWWDNFYKDMSRVDVEGGVKMKNSKKPERLIKWVFDSSTKPDDWVLDSFLGSGTTAAVAMKMGRRFIGIELGEHCYTKSRIRLMNVIDGKDKNGITSITGWKGGSGFKFYELADPLLVKNKVLPVYQINPSYTWDMVSEAICKIEGFTYDPEGEFQGHSSENRFIHITQEYVNSKYVMSIMKNLGEKQSLLIYCKKFQAGIRLPENVEIKKIPKDLLDKCNFDEDSEVSE